VSRAEVFAGVRDCLAAALDVEPGAVREEQRIIGDLGADSLDLLDLTFQLERRFGVSISPRDIERRARERLGGAPLEADGVYTPEALAEIRKALPEVPAEELPPGTAPADLPRRLRVATMVSLVCRLLEEKAQPQ
jgi:acyl carrier protein